MEVRLEASQSLCKPSNGCKTNYSVWRFYLWYEKQIRRKRAIVRKRQTTRPGELVFMRHSKKHEKTNSFLEEVNYYYVSINS